MASHAAGNWLSILMQSGIAADYLTRKHGACPGCGGRDRFRFDDKDGRGTFVCGGGGDPLAGDGFALLAHVHGWHPSEALRFAAGVLGLQSGVEAPARRVQPPKAVQAPVDHSEAVRRVWHAAKPLAGDCAGSRYLAGRGLALTNYPLTLRTHSALPYRHHGEVIHTSAALVGIAQDVHGTAAGLQRIWLDGNGGKAIIEHDGEQLACKKMLSRHDGAMAGAAVRLGEPTEGRLLVCEGIETGLACRGLWPAWPVWCALSTSGMKALLLPESVREVVIAADHDANQAGELAAKALADRLTAAGVVAKIALPPMVGDWLDVLNGKGASHEAA
ncbi:toprim domain-containing protein [Plesiomonas sp. ZOR0011]|uniref:toprim domain-containing protein n=1 Tax=Plesiomonas sp. ZOR0011 TaxID=1339230 RepID=UPI0006477E63|nr:toprim domain-containing protein [Plesiomonas sp. ZOR0011]